MSKKIIYMVALLVLMFFVCNSCIIVPVRSHSSSSNSSSVKEPKKNIIKGKFQVKATKTVFELRDNSGRIYVLQGLNKSEKTRLLKMNGKWIGAEIEVLSKSKAKKQKARLIDIL
ncbi:MAG: hypothetical protein JXJ04_18990 [Spirochaetales bacterium]|nr:hypothetical protein [Spirochaetales bacterium]